MVVGCYPTALATLVRPSSGYNIPLNNDSRCSKQHQIHAAHEYLARGCLVLARRWKVEKETPRREKLEMNKAN